MMRYFVRLATAKEKILPVGLGVGTRPECNPRASERASISLEFTLAQADFTRVIMAWLGSKGSLSSSLVSKPCRFSARTNLRIFEPLLSLGRISR